ncbi:MAG TPA: DNA-binding protein, partial [Xanthomonadaceae bacterium]|nr:DNA-binding protein [Xanthomonadaceae bacterium]
MPEKKTRAAAAKDKREGKSASTQAGEYVKEEIEHVRKGKHGAKNARQAIAIGLSKARRDGVKAKPSKTASAAVKKKAAQDEKAAGANKKPSATRSAGAKKALKTASKKAGTPAKKAVGKAALSRQGKQAASKRSAGSRSAAAKK